MNKWISMIRHPLHTWLQIRSINDTNSFLWSWYSPVCLFLLDSNQILNINWISFLKGTVKFTEQLLWSSSSLLCSHLLLSLFCWRCLLLQQPPPQQRLENKIKLSRYAVLIRLSSSSFSFITLAFPSGLHQLRIPWTRGLACSTEGGTGPASLELTPNRIKNALCFDHWLQAAVWETLVSRISQAKEGAEKSSKAMYKQECRPQSAFRAPGALFPLNTSCQMALSGTHQVTVNFFMASSVLVKCVIWQAQLVHILYTISLHFNINSC